MLLGCCPPLGLEPMGEWPALWDCWPWWVSAPGRRTHRAGCTKEDLLDPAGWSHGTSCGFSSGTFKSRRVASWGLLAGRWLARCEWEPQAWLAWSAQRLPTGLLFSLSIQF